MHCLITLVLTASFLGIVEPAGKPFRWCTTGEKEEKKCAEFVKGLKVVSNLTKVTIDPSCVSGKDDVDCMAKIKGGEADFITLDTGKVYTAGKQHDLVPIVYEETAKGYKGYYAVAIAKKTTEVTLNTMKGKKVCSTGYRRTSGWNMPIGHFLNKVKDFRHCGNPSDAASASKYFAQACVPGAPTGFDNLCLLCDSKKCDKNDKYSGYHGAFNCMKDGKGDVAFAKHLTTREVVGNKTGEYKYLCTNGKSEVVTADSHKNCNFGFSPSHTVMTRSGSYFDDYVKILTNAAQYCQGNSSASKCNGFQMFSSTKFNGKDLLFKDSTTKLLSVGDKNTYEKWLGEYAKSLDAMYKSDPCASSVVFTPYYSLVVAMFVLVKALF